MGKKIYLSAAAHATDNPALMPPHGGRSPTKKSSWPKQPRR